MARKKKVRYIRMADGKLVRPGEESVDGVVVRVSDGAALCIVRDLPGKRRFALDYGKIRGYLGQASYEIGLKAGRRVSLNVHPDGIVRTAELL